MFVSAAMDVGYGGVFKENVEDLVTNIARRRAEHGCFAQHTSDDLQYGRNRTKRVIVMLK